MKELDVLNKSKTEYLFSYGTLQQDDVQKATYGRSLTGQLDSLVKYELGTVAISDLEVIRKSGLAVHPVAVFTGDETHEILGTVFEISKDELLATDTYEVAEYERVQTVLKSGRVCWVYVLK